MNRKSLMAQPTLHERGIVRRHTPGPSKPPHETGEGSGTGEEGEEETDSLASDLTQDLEQTITNVLKRKRKDVSPISLSKKHMQKFLQKATIQFTGYNNKRTGKEPKRLMSQKKSVFKNKTKATVTYRFRRSAEDCTTAHLRVQKGLTVGVLAGIGAGVMGGQASVGAGLAYSKKRELCSGSSQTNAREMEVQVPVPSGELVTATESVYNIEHDAECSFDVTVNKNRHIKYYCDKKEQKISVKDLADESEDSDSEEVHLHRSFSCTLVDSQNELDVVMGSESEEAGGAGQE